MTYQCHNRSPFKPSMTVQDGYYQREGADTRSQKLVTVPFRMAEDCRYTHTTLGQNDAGCNGCSWRKEGENHG